MSNCHKQFAVLKFYIYQAEKHIPWQNIASALMPAACIFQPDSAMLILTPQNAYFLWRGGEGGEVLEVRIYLKSYYDFSILC